MTALLKFLVLLAIFLSASLGDAFVNQARLIHHIRFDASKSNPMIKPSRVPSREPHVARGPRARRVNIIKQQAWWGATYLVIIISVRFMD
jgi:hypothetical protein